MTWWATAKLALLPGLMTLYWGARLARWLLIAEAVILGVVIIWLTATCFGRQGIGTVALISVLKSLIYIGPAAVLGAIGISAGWILRKWMGLPSEGSLSRALMTRRR